MSTGLECNFYGVTDTEWYYLLQHGSCPVQCWDWREYATAYGPFESYEVAREHLSDNHANPGGHSTYHPGEFKQDGLLEALFQEARDERRHELERQHQRRGHR